ncbi:MAG: hypothetical protein ABSD38_20995 [Syntrophorhabdales bacterium]|jgi:hypothetical protein
MKIKVYAVKANGEERLLNSEVVTNDPQRAAREYDFDLNPGEKIAWKFVQPFRGVGRSNWRTNRLHG